MHALTQPNDDLLTTRPPVGSFVHALERVSLGTCDTLPHDVDPLQCAAIAQRILQDVRCVLRIIGLCSTGKGDCQLHEFYLVSLASLPHHVR